MFSEIVVCVEKGVSQIFGAFGECVRCEQKRVRWVSCVVVGAIGIDEQIAKAISV